ncbi:type III secretion outer membrane pore, YscC/HrcC family, partial [Escherichia coli 90.0039]
KGGVSGKYYKRNIAESDTTYT